MNISSIRPPLSNIQAELLKIFNADISDEDLSELKNMIAKFLMDKARDKADSIWDAKGYTDEKIQQMTCK